MHLRKWKLIIWAHTQVWGRCSATKTANWSVLYYTVTHYTAPSYKEYVPQSVFSNFKQSLWRSVTTSRVFWFSSWCHFLRCIVFHQLQMVPIVIGILTGASCLAVKEDGIGEFCHRVISTILSLDCSLLHFRLDFLWICVDSASSLY